MRGVLVALDLETTGLDTSTAQIIEIGAVKFQGDQVLETFSTLVDPESPLPPKITAITGIKPDDLIGAPKLRDVLPKLSAFVGDAVIVGHNIDFDMSFLQKAGILEKSVSVDTYELASVLLPTTPRYNLNALMQELQLKPEGDYHRALADSLATGRVYMALWDKLMNRIPLELLEEIVHAAQTLPWKGTAVFADAVAARLARGEVSKGRWVPPMAVNASPTSLATAAPTVTGQTTLNVDELGGYFVDGGQLASTILSFEQRDSQLSMLRDVSSAFNDDQHLMLEATTGTGRTLAYLLPAAQWAVQNAQPVIISVDSDSQQDLLLNHELPRLKQSLGLNIETAVLKGRSSYLCPRRLEVLRRRLPTSVDELRVLGKVNVWLAEADPAQEKALSLRGPAEYSMWRRLSAEGERCTLDRCEGAMEGVCPFYRARRAAEKAQLIIVNHNLLVADALVNPADDAVLPPYERVIVDEAHNFEEAVTRSLTMRLDPDTIRRQMADVGTLKTGLLGDILSSTEPAIPEKYYVQIKQFASDIAKAINKMHYHIDNLFKDLRSFLETVQNINNSDYLIQVRLSDGMRNKPAFSQVKATWSILSQFIDGIRQAINTLSGQLTKLDERYEIPYSADLIAGTQATIQHLTAIYDQLNHFIGESDSNTIYWIELSADNDYLSIHSAPLNVGTLVKRLLLDSKKSVIMTGATLRAGNSFEYIRQRLSAEHIKEVAVTHRHDYEQSMLLYLPTDMPEPQERNKYQQAVERGIIELAAATQGRMLALFTGYTQLRQVAQNIAPRLALGNIAVFDQSDGTSRESLLEGFHKAERAVLLGTRNLWEDVTFDKNDLVALVIVRLPFAVPSDPIYAARGEQYDNSFNQYTVPDAIVRFRQGVDQLLRTVPDRGIVAVFDKRMTSKEYGQSFLESLPTCTVRRAPLSDLGAAAKEWLASAKA